MGLNPTDKEVAAYLIALRDSGATNMFGAGAYLQRDYGMTEREASEALTKWMGSFHE